MVNLETVALILVIACRGGTITVSGQDSPTNVLPARSAPTLSSTHESWDVRAAKLHADRVVSRGAAYLLTVACLAHRTSRYVDAKPAGLG